MKTTTRFLTGGLASLAISSAVTLAAPSAQADADRPCGIPATPATFTSVFHEPVLMEVPATTHEEWLWERQVTTVEHEFAKVVSAAYDETDWAREIPGTTEHLWSQKVIDRAAVPAVPGTPEKGHVETVVVTPAVTAIEAQYVQHRTGRTRWAPEGWNAGNDEDEGWFTNGNTREVVVTPAVTAETWVVDQAATEGTPEVTELSHVESAWAASSPGAGWTGPHDTRTVGGGTETATTSGNDEPAGQGWSKTASRHIPAVLDTVWAATAPDGYEATGAENTEVSNEQTEATAAAAPDGEGWSKVTGSEVVVVDQPATTHVVPGFTEQVMASPGIPGTDPCGVEVEAPTNSGDGADAVAGIAGAGSPTATVLPATGSPVSTLVATSGFAALLAGSVLVRTSRRRQAD